MRRFVWPAIASLAVLAGVSMARAQGTDTGAAESLFQTGKGLLEQKNYTLACPKLAESYRLDPGTGTLLALALCHEGEGRLATAWGEFAEVVARSRREGRPDRQELAHQHAVALESRLPMLTISVAPGVQTVERLEIRRDGVPVGSGSWATPVPVDPGHHHVEAMAPGFKPYSVTVSLEGAADSKVVNVEALERAPEGPDHLPAAADGDSGKGLRYAGFVTAGFGVAGLAVGAVFGLRAIGFENDSNLDCDARGCGPAGFASRKDAQSLGDASTAAFVAGGVLLAGGTTMVLVARRRSSRGMSLGAAPVATWNALGVRFAGTF